jgi:ribosomal-protein-serine acetyltransferase
MVPERFSTERLVLRRFHRRDAEAVAEAVRSSMPELEQWLPWAHPGYGREEAAAFIRESSQAWREGRAFDFAVRDLGRPWLHLGNASIWFVSRMGRIGEIGYWVRTDRAGNGVATEATSALVELGFSELGMHKINLRIAVGNLASERVAAKLGFHREGILREELLIAGQWVDHTLFSLLERECHFVPHEHSEWGKGPPPPKAVG